MRRYKPTHSREDVEDAVANSPSLAAVLGLRPVGGNHRTLHKLIEYYGLSTDHMDPNWTRRGQARSTCRPLDQVLVEHSTYSRDNLKRRLYDTGLKARRCELCGQGEEWRGGQMSLIIDHINGVGDDHRLENLRIVCPNCAATLDTHCGRKNHIYRHPRPCRRCGAEFLPKYASQRFCSQICGRRRGPGYEPHPERRKVERPSYVQLMAELEATNYCAVARKYGVSDNAVRKRVRWYEADITRRGDAAGDPGRAENDGAGDPGKAEDDRASED